MDGSLAAPDAEKFRAFKAGDEGALAAIYRESYNSLLSASRGELGEDLAQYAPKISQEAMLDAWRDRDRLDNPVGLAAYLEQAVTACVKIQRRKHAALHRRGGHTAVRKAVPDPTADEAVEQLLATIHAPQQSHEQLLAEAKAAKKLHTAEHVQKVGRGPNWKGPLIMIGSLVVIVVAGMWWLDRRSEAIAVDKALEADDARSLSSNRGQRGTVTLNDETVARMGADTRIRMPRDFGGSMRTLVLTGVAHFEVAPGNPLPFQVRAANTVITAAGTAFTVRAYPGDSVVVVSVNEGSVDVGIRGGNIMQTIQAGSAVRVEGETFSPLDAAAVEYETSWMRDTLVFVDMAVKDILPQLTRWYDLNPSLADPSLGDRRVSLRLALQSSGDALQAMADSAKLRIGFDEDEKVVLSDAPAAPARGRR